MYRKFMGFAVVAALVFTACHSILNKDQTSPSTDTASVAQAKVAGTIDSVKIIEKPAPKDSNLRYIYLTFDDGPDAGTLNCYDICKDKGVKATFFLVGEHANYRQGRAILNTMRKDMRHFIFANHSYSHANNRYISFYKHPQQALLDFLRIEDSLHFQYPIARFPGNSAWVMDGTFRSSKLTKPLAKLMDSIGYNVMGWDLEWNFDHHSHPVQSAELMARQVINAFESKSSIVKNHVVILSHDRMFREKNYRDSLDKMITILQSKKGYVFETADQYPKIKPPGSTLLAARK
jgi:peptidoglycan/xylan/chitin deacetylase (PgdA/CDA1 family)